MRGNPANPRVSIIGLGNVLLGDDGFGCLAVEVFRCEYECNPEVEIIDLGTPVWISRLIYTEGIWWSSWMPSLRTANPEQFAPIARVTFSILGRNFE